jgi:hypothetical protein
VANLPVPVPRTWSVGEVGTGAYENSLRDGLNFLLNPPLAYLTQTATQSVGVSSWTAINLDVTVADTYGGHSNVTNNSRYTAQVAGWYAVCGIAAWVSVAASTSRASRLAKNGASIAGSAAFVPNPSNGSSVGVATPTVPVFLNAGDYVEVNGWQTSAGALSTLAAGDLDSSLTVWWIHA